MIYFCDLVCSVTAAFASSRLAFLLHEWAALCYSQASLSTVSVF